MPLIRQVFLSVCFTGAKNKIWTPQQ